MAGNCSVAHSSALCWWLGVRCGALSDNKLGPDGVQALAPSLAMMAKLQTLELSGEYTSCLSGVLFVVSPGLCLCVSCAASPMARLLHVAVSAWTAVLHYH